jgi:hypothetical protein
MALNTRYLILPQLQELFINKTTGLALANGKLKFFRDIERNVGKDVFVLSGNPPDYTYTNIGNEISLNSVGIPSVDNDPVVLYLYPYDENGNLDLYYIEAYDENEVLQQTWEGIIGVSGSDTDGTDLLNFVPNPQFLLHNEIPATNGSLEGQITQEITVIAAGGWTFDRPNSSVADDFITWDRFGSNVTNPTGNPRYAVRARCTAPNAGDAYKDIRLKFNDVNRFSSDTQQYTFGFSAISNSGSDVTVQLILIKNYGSGGSTQEEIDLATLTIEPTYGILESSFIFGLNTGKTIGTLNDDFIQLAIRFPVDATFNVSITDIILTPGAIDIIQFPETTNQEQQGNTLVPPVPSYDASDDSKPVIVNPTGLGYDDRVGDIQYTFRSMPRYGQLACDGDQYEYESYSNDNIPYSRLGDVLWDETANIYVTGTGRNYITTSNFYTGDNQLICHTNSSGTVTATSDGSAPTNFTFSTVHTGATTINCNAYMNSTADGFFIQNTNPGVVTIASSGTSGFTVTQLIQSTPLVPELTLIETTDATSLAGKYFLFNTYNGGDIGYYCWFTVDGMGVDPAVPGRTGIQVNLLSTDNSATVAQKIQASLNSFQVTSIITGNGASFSPGAYFNISSTTTNYYVWYRISGTGMDPNLVGKIGIRVDVLTEDTAEEVAEKTQIAMNRKYYQTPDLRGQFLRIKSGSSSMDPDMIYRFSSVPGVSGGNLNTFQFSSNLQHSHSSTLNLNNATNVPRNNSGTFGFLDEGLVGFVDITGTVSIDNNGFSDARPPNTYVNCFIYY